MPFLQKGPPRKLFQKLVSFETISKPGECAVITTVETSSGSMPDLPDPWETYSPNAVPASIHFPEPAYSARPFCQHVPISLNQREDDEWEEDEDEEWDEDYDDEEDFDDEEDDDEEDDEDEDDDYDEEDEEDEEFWDDDLEDEEDLDEENDEEEV